MSYGGYSVEGTITRLKADSYFSIDRIRDRIKETYYRLTFELENLAGSKEVYAVNRVVFTEGASFERGEIFEDELPFKAGKIELIEKA